MLKVYHIVDSNSDVVTTVYSYEEAYQCIQQLFVVNPQEHYTIEEAEHSTVKPGFGRDPDLH
jgi:hypothetical protein